MESKTIALLNFIEESKQLEIPIYQRTYSWEKENCEQLWEDIVQIGKAETSDFEPGHLEEGPAQVEQWSAQVIRDAPASWRNGLWKFGRCREELDIRPHSVRIYIRKGVAL